MFVRCARQYLNLNSGCCEHKAQNTHKNKRLIPLAVYYTEEDGKFYLVAKDDGSEYMIGPVTNKAANRKPLASVRLPNRKPLASVNLVNMPEKVKQFFDKLDKQKEKRITVDNLTYR